MGLRRQLTHTPVVAAVVAMGAFGYALLNPLEQEPSDTTAVSPDAAECLRSRDRAQRAAAGPPPAPALVALGRRLFADRRLSRDSSVSCQSCHQPDRGFADGRRVAVGVGGRQGERNSPTIVNIAFARLLLWDGKASSLEEQVRLALRNPREMDMTRRLVERRLRGYPAGRNGARRDLTELRAIRAIAAFVRTVQSHTTRVDRFLYCGDARALTAQERRGWQLFSGEANCVRCHTLEHPAVHPFGGARALFTDQRFHAIGAGDGKDPGRAGVTRRSGDRGAFKTPTLRELARTAPYMHDGSLKTLDDVVAFYDRGGGHSANVDPNLRPLYLKPADRRALVKFLRAITSAPRKETP